MERIIIPYVIYKIKNKEAINFYDKDKYEIVQMGDCGGFNKDIKGRWQVRVANDLQKSQEPDDKLEIGDVITLAIHPEYHKTNAYRIEVATDETVKLSRKLDIYETVFFTNMFQDMREKQHEKSMNRLKNHKMSEEDKLLLEQELEENRLIDEKLESWLELDLIDDEPLD